MSKEDSPSVTAAKLPSLLALVQGKRQICVLTHENPDPDSIAGALSLKLLLKAAAGIEAAIAYAGMLWRAENRAMVRFLKIDMQPAGELSFPRFDAVALVDTQPGAGNNLLPSHIVPTMVFDHHGPLRRLTQKAPFYDVRRDYGSVSAMMTEYLLAAGVKIPAPIATALLYGIKTDTQDLTRKVHRADVEAFRHLLGTANLKLLARITTRKRPLTFFQCYHEALESARCYGPVIVTAMRSVANPDLLAIAADSFIRAEGVTWVVVFAPCRDAIYVSVRCSSARQNAAAFVRKTVGRLGTSGGHSRMAGGKIPLPSTDPGTAEQLMQQYQSRVLAHLKRDPAKVRRLLDGPPGVEGCSSGDAVPPPAQPVGGE